MTSILSKAIAAVRVWLGFNDPEENHLHATHGWLLPSAADMRARRLGRVPSPALAPMVAPAVGKTR